MTHIAVVGLGAMGLPMAVNLVKAGHDVTGADLNPNAVAAFTAAGGRAAANAAAAAEGADIALLMVVNGAQARNVLFGDGVAAALRSGGLVIAGYTQAPADAAMLAKDLAALGLDMLDAPVSGGTVGAESGTLAIMVAGPKPVFDRAKPLLDVLGRNIFHVGEAHGQGSTLKMINQLLCGVHLVAAAEAIALAEAHGVAGAIVSEVIAASAGMSWMFGNRGPRMLQDEPPVASAVDIFVKDLGIVLDAGRERRAMLPMSAVAHQLFLAASGAGLGQADDSQVVQVYRKLKGR